ATSPILTLNRKREFWRSIMHQRLLIAYHLIWTAYGHWLPNDPRGSGSTAVLSPSIAALGEVHFGRKRIQPPGKVVREFYEQAAALLRFPVLKFDQGDIERIGAAFAE